MLTVKTVVNRVLKLKRFVVEDVRFDQWKGKEALFVDLRPHGNSHPRCSCCGSLAPVHETSPTPRLFQFLHLFHWAVVLSYPMRRVQCPRCGTAKVEEVEWSEGKSPLTIALRAFVSRWAKELPVQKVSEIFGVSWRGIYESAQWSVEWGLKHRVLGRVEAVGIDEIQIAKGHSYMTVAYQVDQGRRRLLAIARDRTEKSLKACLRSLGAKCCRGIKVACTDMWKPYLKVVREKLPGAMNILDRFHVMSNFNKVVDEIRASESRERAKQGCDVLRHSRYTLLKRPENLTEKQRLQLETLLKTPLKTMKVYRLRESFQALWDLVGAEAAQWFLQRWCNRAMRSEIPKVKKFAKTLKRHEPLILNWFRARKEFSNGITEGMNRKVGLTDRMACGYRNFEIRKTMLFHQHGMLPEPPVYAGLSPVPDSA